MGFDYIFAGNLCVLGHINYLSKFLLFFFSYLKEENETHHVVVEENICIPM